MTQFVYKKLQLENAYSYRNCTVDLANQGLVFVRGLNVDDGGFLGAGKSSIFEALSVVQMGKGGKNTTFQDMINHDAGKNLSVSLWVTINGKEYKLLFTQSHDNFTNGVKAIDLDTGRNVVPYDNAKHSPKWVREELLKMPHTTFFHIQYLAQRMTNVLLTGTDAQRKHQITEMFDLDIYDKLGDYFSTKIKRADTDLRHLETLEEELRGITAILKDSPPIETLQKRVRIRKRKLRDSSVALEASIQELRDTEDAERQTATRASHIKTVKEIWAENDSLKKHMDKPTGCTKKYVRKQQTRLTRSQEAMAEVKEALQQLERRSIIESQIKKFKDSDVDADEVNEQLTEVKTILSYLQNTELPQAEARKETLQKMQAIELPDLELEEAQTKLDEFKAEKTLVTNSVNTYSAQLEGDVCPTCQRPYGDDVSAINEAQRNLEAGRKELKGIQTGLHRYEKYVKNLQRYSDLEVKLNSFKTKRKPQTIQTEISTLTAKERGLAASLEGANRRKLLQGQLDVMPEGSVSDFKKRQRKIKVRIEQTRLRLNASRRIQEELRRIKKIPKKSLRKLRRKVKRLEDVIQAATQEMASLSERLATAQSDLTQVTEASSREAKLTRELKKVRNLVDKVECFRALKIAFGQKGLKHDRLHAIMQEAAERTVPVYANVLWPNRNVSLNLEPTENSIRFQLSRENSDSATSSRGISGGESHKAGLAFLFGLRDLKEVYTNYSSNILILDEPFSHLDPQGKLALLQVLQMLKAKFSSIFVVSHLTEVVNNEAWDKVWWAIRENNESKLYTSTPPARYLRLSQRYEEELNQ